MVILDIPRGGRRNNVCGCARRIHDLRWGGGAGLGAHVCKKYATPTNLLESLKFAGTSMLGRSANLSFNHLEYCTLSELRGVLEHPEHPLWIRQWVWVKLFH